MSNYESDDLKIIGRGTYGIVYKCYSKKIAIKRNMSDKNVSFYSSIRESDILFSIKSHPNIVEILAVEENPMNILSTAFDKKKYPSDRDDLYHFMFELGDSTLHDYIYSKNLLVGCIKNILSDIILGLDYLRINNICHMDLTPQNILIFKNEDKITSKICDFGLSERFIFHNFKYRETTTTHWYRSPEVCNKNTYGHKSDMWAIGCLFFEMLTKKSFISIATDNNISVLKSIARKIKISKEDLSNIRTKLPICDKNLSDLVQFSETQIKNFNLLEDCSYEEALDLLAGLLQFNQEKRLSSLEALNHPFFEKRKIYNSTILEKFSKNTVPDQKFYPIKDDYRTKICNLALNIFDLRSKYEVKNWYSHRIIFHAIRICQSYIHNSDEKIIYDIDLIFMVAIYMMIKYFRTTENIVMFKSILTPKYWNCMKEACEIEKKIVEDIFKFKIYETTVYEAADLANIKLSDKDVCNLIKICIQGESFIDKTPLQLIKIYIKTLDGK